MSSLADLLISLPLFARVPPQEMRGASQLWTELHLAPDEPLWDEGAAVAELGVLLHGELSARLGGAEVGHVGAGELFGEAAAFFAGTTRSAALVARGAAHVLLLPVPGLRTLRWQRAALYDTLLDEALRTLAARVEVTDARIAAVAQGTGPVPVRHEPSPLARLWRAVRPGAPSEPCPPLAPLLARLPGLREAEVAVLSALGSAFSAEAVEEGQVLFLEGEPGSAAFLIASGEVDVFRHLGGDRAERLATLGPGDQVGINTLVEPGPRTASCVVSNPGWLYRMDAAACAKLGGDARMEWRESMLAALANQIRLANSSLHIAVDPAHDEFGGIDDDVRVGR